MIETFIVVHSNNVITEYSQVHAQGPVKWNNQNKSRALGFQVGRCEIQMAFIFVRYLPTLQKEEKAQPTLEGVCV